MTVIEQENGTLKVQEVGHGQAGEVNLEQEYFLLTNVKAYGVEWFWDNIKTPDGTEWIAEAL